MITDRDRYDAILPILKMLEEIEKKIGQSIPEISTFFQKFKEEYIDIVSPDEGGFIHAIAELENGRLMNIIPESTSISEEAPLEVPLESWTNLKIYPFFKEDVRLGKIFEQYTQFIYGAYGCASNMVILHMRSDETVRFQTQTLLHELAHAFLAKKECRAGKSNSRDNHQRLLEEVNIWTTDYNILLAIGGKKYEKEAKRTAHQIYQCWQKGVPVPTIKKGNLLETAYGPAPCETALFRRHFYFMKYCSFMAADYYYHDPVQRNEKKYQILRHEYEKNYQHTDAWGKTNL